jgi:hypothetical protein
VQVRVNGTSLFVHDAPFGLMVVVGEVLSIWKTLLVFMDSVLPAVSVE